MAQPAVSLCLRALSVLLLVVLGAHAASPRCDNGGMGKEAALAFVREVSEDMASPKRYEGNSVNFKKLDQALCALPEKGRHFAAKIAKRILSFYPSSVSFVNGLRERPAPRRLYNGFMVNDEMDLVELRLVELWDVVDAFIVVEAVEALQAKHKPLYFHENRARFEPYRDKIVYVNASLGTGPHTYWGNEGRFRNAIGVEGVQRMLTDPSDLVYVADADELARQDVLWALKQVDGLPSVISLAYRWFLSSFERAGVTPVSLRCIATVGDLAQAGYRTNAIRNPDLPYSIRGSSVLIGSSGLKSPSSRMAGWHCSWCLDSIASWRRKFQSYSHKEHNTAAVQDDAFIRKMRCEGRWIDGNLHGRLFDGVDSLPAALTSKPDKFGYMAKNQCE